MNSKFRFFFFKITSNKIGQNFRKIKFSKNKLFEDKKNVLNAKLTALHYL